MCSCMCSWLPKTKRDESGLIDPRMDHVINDSPKSHLFVLFFFSSRHSSTGMFTSPAPRNTPRRGTSRASISVYSEHVPPTPSIRSSRLRPPLSPTSSAGETTRTVRGEGEGSDRVYWSRDERCSVASVGALPREVASVVKRSGMFCQESRGTF